MKLSVHLSLILAVLVTELSSVEGQCAITSNEITLSGPSIFNDPTNPRFVLHGTSQGGEPTTYTWKRNGVVLLDGAIYMVGRPELMSTLNPCSGRMYRSVLTVIGKLPGVFTYTINNDNTADNKEQSFTIHDADPPTNLTIRQFGRDSIDIFWTAPARTPSRGYSISPTADTTAGIQVANSSYRYTPAPGTTVTITVVSRSSHFSSEVLGPNTFTIDSRDLLAPIATVSAVTSTSAIINLSQPMNSLPAEEYIVTLNRSSFSAPCPYFVHTKTVNGTSDSLLIEGLEESSFYTGIVIARHYSFGITLTISTTAPSITSLSAAPVSGPLELSSSIITSRSITLTWMKIICIDSNYYIDTYDVQYGPVGGDLISRNTESSSTSYTVDGLLPFTEYRFQVAGVNINGTGPYTAFIGRIRTEESVPGPVSGVRVKPQLFSIELSWSPPIRPNGNITLYEVMYTMNGSIMNASVIASSDIVTFTISNLASHIAISNIFVIAHTRIGPGPPNLLNPSSPLGEPPMVTDVVVQVLNDSSVRVSWDRLGIDRITNYFIFYFVTDDENETRRAVYSSESSVVITSLTAGVKYRFQVQAQAMVNGEAMVGQRSMAICTLITPSSSIVITTVVTLFSTIILYSAIIILVLVGCFCHKKHKDRLTVNPKC